MMCWFFVRILFINIFIIKSSHKDEALSQEYMLLMLVQCVKNAFAWRLYLIVRRVSSFNQGYLCKTKTVHSLRPIRISSLSTSKRLLLKRSLDRFYLTAFVT